LTGDRSLGEFSIDHDLGQLGVKVVGVWPTRRSAFGGSPTKTSTSDGRR
jgi:hypothetical protein